jgi:hypothetical protein
MTPLVADCTEVATLKLENNDIFINFFRSPKPIVETTYLINLWEELGLRFLESLVLDTKLCQ